MHPIPVSVPDAIEETPRPLLASTWAELRRRHVVRVAIAYVVVAWVALQVGEVTLGPLGAPAWVMTWAVLAAILGLPIALVLAWYFDATPRGIAREPGARAGPARLFVVGVTLLTVVGVGWWLAQVYEPTDAAGGASDAPPNSVAVLPFDDMSANRDQQWLADGIAEELLDRLARIEGLNVAARTSSFAFRGRAGDVRAIGRALNVALVLEGSVRKAGGRIRVTAQLIDAGNGYHLWSETYERGDEDIFGLQDEVTAAIAAQLERRIGTLGELARGGAPEKASSEASARALELYLEGRQHWRRRTPAALAQARALFERALEADPDFARANAGLADTYLLEVDYGSVTPTEAAQRAEPLAVKAVTLDPQSGEAWATLGLLRLTVGQLDAARSSLEQAIELDPRYEMAPMWLAAVYGRAGRFDEQLRVLRQAQALNPLEPVIAANLSQTLASIGEDDEAIAQLERILAVTPDDDLLLRTLAAVESQRGRLERAARAAKRAYEIDPAAPANITAYGQMLLLLEAWDEASDVFGRLPEGSRVAMRARQVVAISRGLRGIDPELAALADALAKAPATNADDRETLLVAGLARLVASDARGAAPLLQAAAGGEPEALRDTVDAAEAASHLVVALRRIGEADAAAAWQAPLEQVTGTLLANTRSSAFTNYVRAVLAAMRNDRAAALDALEAAYAAGFRDRARLALDPRLDGVRDDPRVQALLARIARDLATARAALD